MGQKMSSIGTIRFFNFFTSPHPKNLNGREWELLLHILDKYDLDKKCAWFNKGLAARRMNCDERQIRRLIWSLEDKGYILVYERARRHNRYVVPRMVGELLPPDYCLHEGPTLEDPETHQTWKLRTHRTHEGELSEDQLWEAEIAQRKKGIEKFDEDLKKLRTRTARKGATI